MKTQVDTNAEPVDERRDQPLDEAFHRATGGAVASPNILQRALFPRLLTQDTGLLVPTGPAAGRLEAVFVPTMASRADSAHYGVPRQRLFIIAPDGCPLDDYYERFGRYLHALAQNADEPRTLFIASGTETPICERYMPDGSIIENACDHPLDPGVDLAVAPFSHFRSLFFGAGGVHALPQSLLPSGSAADMRPRDLFYFDDSIGYSTEELTAFLRLVEFLFAQDLDLIVGTTTLPGDMSGDLSFLETLIVPEAEEEPQRSLQTVIARPSDFDVMVEDMVIPAADGQTRVIVCVDDKAQLERVAQRLAGNAHQNIERNLFRYEAGMPLNDRVSVYTTLLSREKEGLGYVLVADGPSVEASDLSADLLISAVCAPEALVRRAGRVNRRGRQPLARIVVAGEGYIDSARPLSGEKKEAYWRALAMVGTAAPFQSDDWKEFVA